MFDPVIKLHLEYDLLLFDVPNFELEVHKHASYEVPVVGMELYMCHTHIAKRQDLLQLVVLRFENVDMGITCKCEPFMAGGQSLSGKKT